MNVLVVAYVDSRTRFAAEFVEMSVRKICAEFYFVNVGVAHADFLA